MQAILFGRREVLSSLLALPLLFSAFTTVNLIAAPSQQTQSFYAVDSKGLLNSDLIFVGQVISTSSFRDSRGLILTRYEFLIREPLKGKATGTVELTEYGGSVGNESMSVSHSANLSRGQEYIIFAAPDLAGRLRTVGGPLGSLLIVADGYGNRRIRLVSDHPLIGVVGKGPLFRDADELTGRIRSAVQEVAE